MRDRPLAALCCAAFVFLLSGCGVIYHDEDRAATEAELFAELAFVNNDTNLAYERTTDGFKETWSPEKFAILLENMHPALRPATIQATHFEPIPGQKAMNILLHGLNGEENFYYRLLMMGTGVDGYKVSGVFRGSGPYPSTPLVQPLNHESTE